MLWILVPIVVLVIAAVFWLKQTTSYKTAFIIFSSAAKTEVYQYLSSPINLTEYHPTFFKVSDVTQDNEGTRCIVEENIRFLGKIKIPLLVSAFSDVPSHLSSTVRLEFLDDNVRVVVKLIISDNDEDNSHEKSKIEAAISVEGWRLIAVLFSKSVTQKWISALNKVKAVMEQ